MWIPTDRESRYQVISNNVGCWILSHTCTVVVCKQSACESNLHVVLTVAVDVVDVFLYPRSGELRTQKLQSYLERTQSLNVLSLTPGVGQYIAIHTTLTAKDFFPAYFYPSSPFICIFSKTSPDFFPVLALPSTGSCVGPQNKIGHPAGCRFRVECPRKINRLKKHDLWYDDL